MLKPRQVIYVTALDRKAGTSRSFSVYGEQLSDVVAKLRQAWERPQSRSTRKTRKS